MLLLHNHLCINTPPPTAIQHHFYIMKPSPPLHHHFIPIPPAPPIHNHFVTAPLIPPTHHHFKNIIISPSLNFQFTSTAPSHTKTSCTPLLHHHWSCWITQYMLHMNLNFTTVDWFCWPMLLGCITYTHWRWPFKCWNMVELHYMLIQWWLNNIIWVYLSVLIGYVNFSWLGSGSGYKISFKWWSSIVKVG